MVVAALVDFTLVLRKSKRKVSPSNCRLGCVRRFRSTRVARASERKEFATTKLQHFLNTRVIMSTVRQVISEAKHSDGLTQWKTAVLDLNGRDVNYPEWLRRVRTWLELNAIDGTASGLSVSPFVEPGPAWPEEIGPNSWIPVNPTTGDPAVLEPAILTKLKAAKFSAYETYK